MSFGPHRRVITGVDNNGQSVVLFDDDKGFATTSGPTSVTLLWQTDAAPASNSGVADAANAGFSFDFAPGASKCIMVDIAPTQELMPPGMHATDTLDYVVVLAGSLSLFTDSEEVKLRPGDVVVNRGNRHAWRNTGTETARMLVVTVDAIPLGLGETWRGLT